MYPLCTRYASVLDNACAKYLLIGLTYPQTKLGVAGHALECQLIEDCGRAINPLTLHGQAIGSAVQGLGGAMMEHLIYDAQGQLLTGSLADYLIPVNADIPDLQVILVAEEDAKVNPLGVKGIGEIGTAAAVANAVYHATGKRARDYHITLDQLL